MGARLWSDRRGGNRSSNPSSPRHTHHTSLTPANFTHSVLYVCEGVRRSSSNSVRVAMDAARDRKTRYQSVQQDTTMGYPIQVPLPDGEEWPYAPATLRAQTGSEQEAEIYRGCIKPPPNKTIGIDEKGGVPPRSSSIGGLASGAEWGAAAMYRSNSTGSSSSTGGMQRHSAPLDPRYNLPSSSSSSSSASSVSSSLLLEDERASPRRTRTAGSFAYKGSQIFDKCSRTISSITSPKESSRGHHHRSSAAAASGGVGVGVGGVGVGVSGAVGGGLGGMGLGGGGGVGLGMMPGAGRLHESAAATGMRVNSPPRSNTQLLQYHSTSSSALSDITSVQCESAGPNLGHTGSRPPGSPHGLYQPCPPHPGFGPSSHSGAQTHSSPLMDRDSPPLYSEVIENPTQFRSRPSEQRTNSGKI